MLSTALHEEHRVGTSWGRLLVCLPTLTKWIDLDKDKFTIGRHPSCDLSLDSWQISKHHLILSQAASNACPILEDASRNGSYVNGRLVHGKMMALTHLTEIELKHNFFLVFFGVKADGCTMEDTAPSATQGGGLFQKYYVFDHITLGEGTFATVHLAVHLETAERLACKIMQAQKLVVPQLLANIHREIGILRALDHPNIISIKDVIKTPCRIYLFLTRVGGGELFDYIQSHSRLEEYEAKFTFYQLLLAMKYLHDQNIVHRDLKPENLLLESATPFSRLFITDFGLAKALQGSFQRMRTKCGTYSYLAPEVLTGGSEGYSKKVDSWSLGVLLYTMLSGFLPFGTDEDPGDLMARIRAAHHSFPAHEWGGVSVGAKDLIAQLLVVDPEERLSVDGALKHYWIQDQIIALSKLYDKMLEKSKRGELMVDLQSSAA